MTITETAPAYIVEDIDAVPLDYLAALCDGCGCIFAVNYARRIEGEAIMVEHRLRLCSKATMRWDTRCELEQRAEYHNYLATGDSNPVTWDEWLSRQARRYDW